MVQFPNEILDISIKTGKGLIKTNRLVSRVSPLNLVTSAFSRIRHFFAIGCATHRHSRNEFLWWRDVKKRSEKRSRVLECWTRKGMMVWEERRGEEKRIDEQQKVLSPRWKWIFHFALNSRNGWWLKAKIKGRQRELLLFLLHEV